MSNNTEAYSLLLCFTDITLYIQATEQSKDAAFLQAFAYFGDVFGLCATDPEYMDYIKDLPVPQLV